jgi:hypothetical protein
MAPVSGEKICPNVAEGGPRVKEIPGWDGKNGAAAVPGFLLILMADVFLEQGIANRASGS